MKFVALLILISINAYADVIFYTWNLKHLGRKNQDLDKVAEVLHDGEMIVLQEVNTGDSGTAKLKKLAGLLEDKSKKHFCLGLSEIPTDSKERYAMLWKESEIAYVTTKGEILDKCVEGVTLRLGTKDSDKIIREPAVGVFYEKETMEKFLAASVHLVPTGKSPAKEVPFVFDSVNEVAGNLPTILGGDFNLHASHDSFKAAKALNFVNIFAGNVKTSLKSKARELSEAYDNIFTKAAKTKNSEVINLYRKFENTEQKYIYDEISDHCALRAEIDIRPEKK